MRYSPRAALLLACVVATPCLAEKHTVQGVVQDEFGKPVQGAVLEFIRGEWSPDVWAIPIITPKVVGVIAGRDSYRSGRVVESHKTKTDQAGGFRQAMKSVVALFAVAVAIGVRFFGMGHSASHGEHDSAATPVSAASPSVRAATEPLLPAPASVSDKSIAVLPLMDMSEKKDQEYFGNGMAEEILDLLAKIPGLTVIGRTSSFQFKGKESQSRTMST